MNVEIVVAKYNEDISWTKNLKYKVTIYNKDENDNHFFENNLPNYGKDAHTHLYHIINNWENLADYTIFLQGNPFDHNCQNCVNLINECRFEKDFYPIGPTYERDNYGCIQQAINYCEEMEIPYKLPFIFIAGVQCIVKKELIKRNTKEFYQKLIDSIHKTISKSSAPSDGNSPNIWALEYTWLTIFGVNEEIKPEFNNC